ncbi:SGNH/GDSL hydrolase family protein [Sphingomonas sp. ZB1N12]|uniref:SGNH/GDSL hydrolase family protein n=1 Tax=Sphingomonas arabinosi TaxID=3096160 RepID=UPI002FC80435
MTSATEFQTDVDKVVTNFDRLDQYVNSNGDVQTDVGPVPSFPKLLRQYGDVGVARDVAVDARDDAVSARNDAVDAADRSVIAVSATLGGGPAIQGGPEVGFASNVSPLSPLTWVHPEPVPRVGVLRTFTSFVKRAGAIRLGFIDDAGNVVFSRVVTFAGTGKQTVAVAPGAVRAGWRVCILGDASNSAEGSGAQLGYMAFGTALSGPAIAADGTVVTGLSVYIGATIALAYDLDAADSTIAQRNLTAKRIPIYASTLQSYPAAWVESGTSPWSFGAGGMTSPATGQGWGSLMQTNWWTRLERRLTRLTLSGMTDATIVSPAWRAPDQGAPLYEGNGRGPSLCTLNWVNRTLAIKIQPNGNSDPGNVYSVPLSAGHVAANPQLLEWEWRVRDQILTVTDIYSGAVTTLANPVTGTATNTDLPGGNMNDALAFYAVAGRFTVSRAEVLYNRPAPKVLAIGDSITQGDQQLAAKVWSRMLDEELDGAVAVSAMGGGRMRGAWHTSRAEIAALKPAWLIVAVGTNNGDNDLETTQAYLGSIIRRAKSQGTKVILTTILNTAYGNGFGSYNAQNGVMNALAAADPDNVFVWRWNRALSISGQGAAADASKFHGDLVHPNDAGNLALLAQLHADVPQLFD